MASFNKVILMGNLTKDPMVKYLPSGTPVAEMRLAVNRTWNDQASGEKREAVAFVDCRAMGRQAETIQKFMRKGSPILVEGRLEYREWDAKDGTKRNKLDVFVEGFQFVGGRREDGGGSPMPSEGSREGASRFPTAAAAGYDESEAGGASAGAPRGADDSDTPF